MPLLAFVIFAVCVLAVIHASTRMAGLLGLTLIVWLYPLAVLLLLTGAGTAAYCNRRRSKHV